MNSTELTWDFCSQKCPIKSYASTSFSSIPPQVELNFPSCRKRIDSNRCSKGGSTTPFVKSADFNWSLNSLLAIIRILGLRLYMSCLSHEQTETINPIAAMNTAGLGEYGYLESLTKTVVCLQQNQLFLTKEHFEPAYPQSRPLILPAQSYLVHARQAVYFLRLVEKSLMYNSWSIFLSSAEMSTYHSSFEICLTLIPWPPKPQ